jgi:hypothetical protein
MLTLVQGGGGGPPPAAMGPDETAWASVAAAAQRAGRLPGLSELAATQMERLRASSRRAAGLPSHPGQADVSGREIVDKLIAVLDEELPLVAASDPTRGHLADLHAALRAQQLTPRRPRGTTLRS